MTVDIQATESNTISNHCTERIVNIVQHLGKFQIKFKLGTLWFLITVDIQVTKSNSISNHCSYWKEYKILQTEM